MSDLPRHPGARFVRTPVEGSGIGARLVAKPFDIWAVMFDALQCLCDAIEDRPVCACSVVGGIGPMPTDSCVCSGDDCGIAWVRLDSAYPCTAFPTPDATVTSCTAPLAYTVHVGIARCQPQPDDAGNLPDVESLTAAARDTVADMNAARVAVTCCLSSLNSRNVFVSPWVACAAEDGGCSGGYWPVTIWGVG